MQIDGSQLAQLLQTGTLQVGGVKLTLDPTLDFVRKYGKITVDFKIDSEPNENVMYGNLKPETDLYFKTDEDFDPIRGDLLYTSNEGSYTTSPIKTYV